MNEQKLSLLIQLPWYNEGKSLIEALMQHLVLGFDRSVSLEILTGNT